MDRSAAYMFGSKFQSPLEKVKRVFGTRFKFAPLCEISPCKRIGTAGKRALRKLSLRV